MAGKAHQYRIDMRGFPDEEFARVKEILENWSFTNVIEVEPRVFTFIWNDPQPVWEVANLASEVFQQIL